MSSGEPRLIRSLTAPTLRPGRRLIPALVGHNSEWLTLAGELERAIKGRGRFVRIIGDVGVGKSRLKMELYRELEARGIAVREARASEATAGSALGPFVDLLHAWLRSLGAYGGDSRLRAFKRLARQSGLSASESARIEGLLITSGSVGGSGGDEQVRGRAEAFAAFRTLLLSTQRTAPLVLVLEDFHLADPQSVELTLELAQHIRQSATLLLVIETISSAAFEREPNRVDIVLAPLGALAARKLLREVLPDVDVPAELFERIEPAIRGNPGFLLQTLHAWVDADLLRWDGNRYRFATPPQKNDVPTSMQQAIERRLVRLASEDRRLLLQGSVLGRAFSPRILVEIETAITGEGRSTIAARLERIANANLLDPTGQSGRLGFMHGVIYEQVRSLLKPEDATRIHQLAAEAYLSADDSEESISPEQLAHHWQAAGQPYKAVPHLIAAADRSRVAFDYERAATVYHQALELLEADSSSEASENRRRIWENLSDVLLVRGDYEAARSALASSRRGRPEDLANPNPIDEARHLKKLASIAQKTGQYAEALRLCQQALALVENIDPLMAASLEALGGLTLCYEGQYATAQEWIMRGLSRIDETTQSDERARLAIEAALHRAHGNLLVDMGRPQEAVEEYTKGAPLCEQLGDRWELSIVYFNIGAGHAQAGRPAQALESLERALTAKLAIGDRWGLSYTYHAMAEIHAELGAPQRQARTSGALGAGAGSGHGAGAGASSGAGAGPGAAGGASSGNSLSGVDRALITLAFNEAQKGLVLAQEVGDPKILAALRVTLGRLHMLENELDAAERQFAEAFASAHAIHALPEVIGSKLGMAALYRERRAYGLALHEAESALRLAQERGLPRWVVESLISVGDSLLRQGAYEDAERKYAAALQAAGQVQNQILESTALAALTHVKRLKPTTTAGSRETGRPSGGEGGRESARGSGRGSVRSSGRGPDRQTGGLLGKDLSRPSTGAPPPGTPEIARPFRDTGRLLFKDLSREGAPSGRDTTRDAGRFPGAEGEPEAPAARSVGWPVKESDRGPRDQARTPLRPARETGSGRITGPEATRDAAAQRGMPGWPARDTDRVAGREPAKTPLRPPRETGSGHVTGAEAEREAAASSKAPGWPARDTDRVAGREPAKTPLRPARETGSGRVTGDSERSAPSLGGTGGWPTRDTNRFPGRDTDRDSTTPSEKWAARDTGRVVDAEAERSASRSPGWPTRDTGRTTGTEAEREASRGPGAPPRDTGRMGSRQVEREAAKSPGAWPARDTGRTSGTDAAREVAKGPAWPARDTGRTSGTDAAREVAKGPAWPTRDTGRTSGTEAAREVAKGPAWPTRDTGRTSGTEAAREVAKSPARPTRDTGRTTGAAAEREASKVPGWPSRDTGKTTGREAERDVARSPGWPSRDTGKIPEREIDRAAAGGLNRPARDTGRVIGQEAEREPPRAPSWPPRDTGKIPE